jgi:hypothetical protein
MVKNILCASVLVASCMAVYAPNAFAEEQKYELRSASTSIKDVLAENVGKRVIVRLDTGDNLEGTMTKVGDTLVHFSKITGRDFYDAVVRIDKISAVMFKVRGN